MPRNRRSTFARGLTTLSAAALMLVVAGDRAVHSVAPPGLGIDPFEVLDLQVKPNVLFVLDTSGSMQEDPPTTAGQFISGDDTNAKMYQAKKAINTVLANNSGRFNFGFATYNVRNDEKVLTDFPLTYVSTNGTAPTTQGATIWSGGNSYFSTSPGTPYLTTGYTTNANDGQVYRSFARVSTLFPGPGCSGSSCRVHLRSRLFRTGLRFKWSTTATSASGQPGSVGTSDILTSITAIDCSTLLPPAGLFPDDPPGMVRPCIQMQNSASGGNLRTTTFWYAGARWDPGANGTANCGGAAVLDSVAPCEVNNIPQIQRRLQLEFPLWDIADTAANTNTCGGPRGMPCALVPQGIGTATAIVGTNPAITAGLDPNVLGVASAQRTPLGATLRDVYNNFGTTFPLPGGGFDSLQRHFIVLLTDGAETCGTNAPYYANQLWARNGHAGGQYAETFVVGFSLSAADQATLNAISCAGSGGTVSSCGSTTCSCTGGTRPTALSANDAATLADTITNILGNIAAEGTFSSTPSVFDAIPEYVDTVTAPVGQPRFTPLNPTTRYNGNAFRSYRASFDTNGFKGMFTAFDSNGVVTGWEAGQKLLARISSTLNTTDQTFQQITTGGQIRRRIFTTTRNGIAPTNAMLWNINGPDAAVAPNSYSTAGSLDNGLFLKSDGTQMTQAELETTPLYACKGSNLPTACTSGTASVKLAASKREAREMILAYMAGAAAVRDGSGNPTRNASGAILYRARSWILGTSVLATPAVITPPLNKVPSVHQAEYLLFRDGPRNASTGESVDALDSGFGLRNPDTDGREQPNGPQRRLNLKPVMSVVYLPANDMLHAFRAGPQCPTVELDGSCPVAETGGEELWGFVPYDQLPKLRDRLRVQTRTDHVYMFTSSLRFADIFIPSREFTVEGKTYTGRWRRVLMAGRGAGGSYYTTLDVTVPGPFTRDALSTNLPSVLWSRGNPDTVDSTTGGTRNGTPGEYTAYADLGQTWSAPAITRSAAFSSSPEYVAHFGSGYGSAANQGTRFYTIDLRNGNILASADVGDRAGMSFENALVADPATYAGELIQATNDAPHPAGVFTTAIYIGDIHGRMWKFGAGSSADLQSPQLFLDAGADQPMGVGAALLNLGTPFVFFSSGADSRVSAPASQFKVWAVEDEGTLPGTVVTGFPVAFPAPGVGEGPYRGTVPPLTAFQESGDGVVFFVGTRFNPISAGRCVSSFDSIILALFAQNATSAYDTLEYTGSKIVGLPVPPIPIPGGGIPADVANPPPGSTLLPPPPVPESGPATSAVVVTRAYRPSSSVCRF